MNALHNTPPLLAASLLALLLGGCAAAPSMPEGAAATRNQLTQLQADAQLANRAPVAMQNAEAAVLAAEQPRSGKAQEQALGQHLVLLAERRVAIARARAQTRWYEDQRTQLGAQRETARLDARTLEADQAQRENQLLQAQIDQLNAKPTERGLMITLGDLLFATGGSQLYSGSAHNLDRLVLFLNQHPERELLIEGHTDSVGSDAANLSLSQRRADSVQGYLRGQGIASNRMYASGKGEHSPVADNDTAAGRQMNRRVEVIIRNNLTSQR